MCKELGFQLGSQLGFLVDQMENALSLCGVRARVIGGTMTPDRVHFQAAYVRRWRSKRW